MRYRNRAYVKSATVHRSALLALYVLLGLLVALPHAARAQDTYKVNYFANNLPLPVPDETVRIVNPMGSDRCALIYVFDANQHLQECCGCLLTHNALLSLSVRNQLTATLAPPTGVIKLLSSVPSTGGACDPTAPVPTPTLRAWATHNQNTGTTLIQKVTEEEFEDAPLDPLELGLLEDDCLLAQRLKGICSCAIPTAPGP